MVFSIASCLLRVVSEERQVLKKILTSLHTRFNLKGDLPLKNQKSRNRALLENVQFRLIDALKRVLRNSILFIAQPTDTFSLDKPRKRLSFQNPSIPPL